MFFHILFLLFSHLKLFPLFKSATLGEAQQTVSSKDTLKKTPIEIKFSTLLLTSCKGIQRRRVSTWNWLFKAQYQPRCTFFEKGRWNFVWQKLFTTGFRQSIEKSCKCLFTKLSVISTIAQHKNQQVWTNSKIHLWNSVLKFPSPKKVFS